MSLNTPELDEAIMLAQAGPNTDAEWLAWFDSPFRQNRELRRGKKKNAPSQFRSAPSKPAPAVDMEVTEDTKDVFRSPRPPVKRAMDKMYTDNWNFEITDTNTFNVDPTFNAATTSPFAATGANQFLALSPPSTVVPRSMQLKVSPNTLMQSRQMAARALDSNLHGGMAGSSSSSQLSSSNHFATSNTVPASVTSTSTSLLSPKTFLEQQRRLLLLAQLQQQRLAQQMQGQQVRVSPLTASRRMGTLSATSSSSNNAADMSTANQLSILLQQQQIQLQQQEQLLRQQRAASQSNTWPSTGNNALDSMMSAAAALNFNNSLGTSGATPTSPNSSVPQSTNNGNGMMEIAHNWNLGTGSIGGPSLTPTNTFASLNMNPELIRTGVGGSGGNLPLSQPQGPTLAQLQTATMQPPPVQHQTSMTQASSVPKASSSTASKSKRKDKTGRKFQCQYCHKSFPGRVGLVRHVRVHTGEKPFQCTECGKRFKQKGTLTSHARIHTGEMPFACSMCGTKFRHSGNLRRHQRTCKAKGGGRVKKNRGRSRKLGASSNANRGGNSPGNAGPVNLDTSDPVFSPNLGFMDAQEQMQFATMFGLQ